MKEITTIIYETIDGKQFEDKEEAQGYEKVLLGLRFFRVSYEPSKIEGVGYQKTGFIITYFDPYPSQGERVADYFCAKKFSYGYEFINDEKTLDKMIKKYNLTSCNKEDVEADKILANLCDTRNKFLGPEYKTLAEIQ